MKLDRFKVECLMGQKGLNFGKLAEEAGMSRQNLTAMFERKRNLPVSIARISTALGVSIEEITKPD